jgi:hypothetical protein
MPALAALITVLILERPLCVDCIAKRAHTSPRIVLSYLRQISTSLSVQRGDDDRCRTCGAVGKTYSFARID